MEKATSLETPENAEVSAGREKKRKKRRKQSKSQDADDSAGAEAAPAGAGGVGALNSLLAANDAQNVPLMPDSQRYNRTRHLQAL